MDSHHGHNHHQPIFLPPIATLTTLPDKRSSVKISSLPLRSVDSRDSSTWSLSKHSSTSTNGIQVQSLLNLDDGPLTPAKINLYPPPQHRLQQQQQQHASLLPFNTYSSSSSPFDNHRNIQASLEIGGSFLDSRRSSIDSRTNSGLSHLMLSSSSLYDSQNVSRASLVSSLQQQRGIAATTNDSTSSNSPEIPQSPNNGPRATTSSSSSNAAPRRAPVINPNPRSVSGMPDPLAAVPTKGYPWAFPDQAPPESDEEIIRRCSSGSSIENNHLRRENSISTSINSSVFTADSALPPGQKRFSEDIQNALGSHLSASHLSVGSYSRTPELRISHKIAERKRRSEMKGLFEELNGILPTNAAGKSSKWEVLTRAIDYVKKIKPSQVEMDKMMREARQLREELESVWQVARRAEPDSSHIYGSYTRFLTEEYHRQQQQQQQQYHHHHSAPSTFSSSASSSSNHHNQHHHSHHLPLTPTSNSAYHNSSMMQGVEYQNHSHLIEHRGT